MLKKIYLLVKPLPLAILSLLIVTSFFRYYLYVNSAQLVREFKNQNYRELYSIDTLKISSRLSSLSSAINWVCIDASVGEKSFYKIERGECSTSWFTQNQELSIPEASYTKIKFTVKLPHEVEVLFSLFIILQSMLIIALVISTKKDEEEKRQNEMKINKLARQMFHDIRSPLATLNTIINNQEFFDQNDKRLINLSIERINQISSELLANSRSIITLKQTNLSQLILDLSEEKKAEFSAQKDVSILYTISHNNLTADIDALAFKRIISNMINNSVDAKGRQLIIQISLKKLSDKVQIIIEDNGTGISADILNQLGKKETTTKSSGNGLGLMHALENISSWRGTTNIQSIPGKGTKIEILLPLSSAQRTKTILIDDDELVRLTWKSAAKKKDIDFAAFESFPQLEEVIDDLDFDSPIYIDSQLAEGNKGEAIAKILHEKGFNAIYMASGFNSDHFSELTFLKGTRDKSPPW